MKNQLNKMLFEVCRQGLEQGVFCGSFRGGKIQVALPPGFFPSERTAKNPLFKTLSAHLEKLFIQLIFHYFTVSCIKLLF